MTTLFHRCPQPPPSCRRMTAWHYRAHKEHLVDLSFISCLIALYSSLAVWHIGERGKLIQGKGITVVSESGLFTPEHIAYVQEAGVQAVLVGESLVKQSDPGQGISGLFGKHISS